MGLSAVLMMILECSLPNQLILGLSLILLQEVLEECRSEHNEANQQLETKLDVVLAMMREGSTDEVYLLNCTVFR